ncbi:LuxR C-terminal-related transcriptional regulator [Salipiger sp. H15]|uniref:LuxR C-terminal-related transcriptional regulator n=1 Tax=Alloyangia sp. H15 TaxID=3029062 RepID=A0AAU8AL07_9RHOB
MSDIAPSPLPRDRSAALAALVPEPGFGAALLTYIRDAADIVNFGAFYVSDLKRPEPVLSIWSGEMSDYWFRRNARTIASHDSLRQDFSDRIRRAPEGGLVIDRWHPPADDPRATIYARDQVIERVSVASRIGRGGLVSFYLRGVQAGWLSDEEVTRLRAVLPLAHELIGLRHRIVGNQPRLAAGRSFAALRADNVGAFAGLTMREAEICDLAARGLSVEGTALDLGISANTVRTLRRRAYRRLQVATTTQLTALLYSDRQ